MEERDKLLGELREKYGKVAAFETEDGELVVVARPQKTETHDILINQLSNDKLDRAKTLRNFALGCVVHPSREEAEPILRRYPFFADDLAARAQELGRGGAVELGKD